MSGLEDLLVASLAATAIGAAVVLLAPGSIRRLAFVTSVVIECLLALGVSVGVLAYGTQVRIALWLLLSLGQLLFVVDPLAALFGLIDCEHAGRHEAIDDPLDGRWRRAEFDFEVYG